MYINVYNIYINIYTHIQTHQFLLGSATVFNINNNNNKCFLITKWAYVENSALQFSGQNKCSFGKDKKYKPSNSKNKNIKGAFM